MRINFTNQIIFVKPLYLKVASFFLLMKTVSLLTLIIAIIFSCTGRNSKETVDKGPTGFYSIAELDERLANADSAVFVFFTDPFTKDSLQYTRFYKQYPTTATADIQSMLEALNGSFTKEERPRPCRNEGKAWIFAGKKIFQTIYFGWSRNNCAFIYLIKDGFFYYTDIKPPFISTLTNCRSKATEP